MTECEDCEERDARIAGLEAYADRCTLETAGLMVKVKNLRDALEWMIKIFKGRADGMGEVAVIENAEQALKETGGAE